MKPTNRLSITTIYHCQHDDLFETTTGTQARSISASQWQYKAGLVKGKPELSGDEQMKDEQWEEKSLRNIVHQKRAKK
jgi:hypothetical protein